jgi:hypothetical protein
MTCVVGLDTRNIAVKLELLRNDDKIKRASELLR